MAKNKTATLKFIIAGDAKGPNGAQTTMRTVGVEADGLAAKAKKVAGFLTAGAVVAWGRQTVQTYRTVGGEMLKIQRLTGASDEAASGIWVAAQQSGVGVEKLSSAVAIFQSKLQKGQLDKYGLGLTDATGKAIPFEEALRKIQTRFEGMDDASEKVDLARALFGKSGTDLMPLLNKGGDALDEYIAKAKELGLELNSDDVKEATKNQRDFQLAMTSTGFVIGKEVLPLATKFTSWAAQEMPRVVGWATSAGDAIGSLPGPLKAVLGAVVLIGPAAKGLSMIATPFRIAKDAAAAGRSSLEMFRFGLAGVTQQGAGAANMMGQFIGAMGPGGVAAGVAGLGLISAAVYKIQLDSQRAKANVRDLVSDMADGATAAEAIGDKLGRTLTQKDNGFEGLTGSSEAFRDSLAKTGVDLSEVSRALAGTDAEWKAFYDGLDRKDMTGDELYNLEINLIRIRKQAKETKSDFKTQEAATKDLAISTDDLADSTAGATGELEKQLGPLQRAEQAMTALRNRQRQISDAQQAVADAHTASRDAQDALTEARRAAEGQSEAYESAERDIEAAEQAVGDAQREVADAQRARTDAVQDLADAIEGAKDRLREMAQATRDAALAEEEANLKVKESRQELERKARDPRATALERERAALELKKAQEEARQAGEDNAAQQAANAAAQAAGVNGDREVIRARQGVADANRAVIDAEKGVAEAVRQKQDAERKAAKIISDARAEIAAAAKRSEDAVIKEAEAWGALAEAQNGPIAGAKAYRDFLTNLTKDLDPNAPLAQRVAQLLADVDRAIALARIVQSGTTTPPTRDPDRGLPTSDGANSRSSDARSGGDIYNLEVNQTLQGTTTQQARQARASATDALDDFAKGAR